MWDSVRMRTPSLLLSSAVVRYWLPPPYPKKKCSPDHYCPAPIKPYIPYHPLPPG